MKFKKPKLICYDWDNTIVNTNPITLKALNLLYSKYNMPELTMMDVIRINGYYFADMFTAVFGKKNTLAIQQEYQSIYDNYAKCMLQPLVGAINTIKMMNDFGIKQAVISNKPSYIVKREAEAVLADQNFSLCGFIRNVDFFRVNCQIQRNHCELQCSSALNEHYLVVIRNVHNVSEVSFCISKDFLEFCRSV